MPEVLGKLNGRRSRDIASLSQTEQSEARTSVATDDTGIDRKLSVRLLLNCISVYVSIDLAYCILLNMLLLAATS